MIRIYEGDVYNIDLNNYNRLEVLRWCWQFNDCEKLKFLVFQDGNLLYALSYYDIVFKRNVMLGKLTLSENTLEEAEKIFKNAEYNQVIPVVNCDEECLFLIEYIKDDYVYSYDSELELANLSMIKFECKNFKIDENLIEEYVEDISEDMTIIIYGRSFYGIKKYIHLKKHYNNKIYFTDIWCDDTEFAGYPAITIDEFYDLNREKTYIIIPECPNEKLRYMRDRCLLAGFKEVHGCLSGFEKMYHYIASIVAEPKWKKMLEDLFIFFYESFLYNINSSGT